MPVRTSLTTELEQLSLIEQSAALLYLVMIRLAFREAQIILF